MSDTVEQIKQKLSIVDVVASYVPLTRAGRYHKGLSPFNKEKTPSFFVNPERGSYYCFSSSQGGDMFTFIEKMEGVDFKGALKILAEKAGVPLDASRGRPQDREKKDRLREVLFEAEQFFKHALTETSDAYAYALSRGLTKETISSWNLGCAPDAWRSLLEALSAKGFTVPELVAAGLVKEADEKRGTFYDRFRNRLMFPIRDGAGRTIAFTGRTLDSKEQAKYLNSPETELFKKSNILFGMDRAKDAIRTRGFALLVEGQFDLILLHQIGFTNTIALSGTALSDTHVSLIRRYANNLMLSLDADRAGLSASFKTAYAALASGMSVKAVRLPEEKDPADVASEDPKAFTTLVKEAEPIVPFFVRVLSKSEKDQHRLIKEVERSVLPLVSVIPSSLEREHFVGIIARSLSLTSEAVRLALPKVRATDPSPRDLPVTRKDALPKPSPKDTRALFLQALAVHTGGVLAKKIEDAYARITGTSFPEGELPERVLFEAGLAFDETPTEAHVEELLRAFERDVLDFELAEATMRLRAAETVKNEEEIREAMALCTELSRRLSSFA